MKQLISEAILLSSMALCPAAAHSKRVAKLRRNSLLLTLLSFGVVFSLPLSGFAAATAKYWDIDGATAGSGPDTTPDGTWSTSVANWSTAVAGNIATANWVNDAGGAWKARFSASTDATGAFTVTCGSVTVAQIGFQHGTVTLTSGTITLVGVEADQILTGIGTGTPGASTPVIIYSAIAGTVGLSINHAYTTANTTTLGNTANSWTGGMDIGTGETVKLGAANVIPNANNVSVIGTLDMNGFSETIDALSGSGTIIMTAGTTLFVNAFTDVPSSTFSGAITGAGQFAKSGTGTLTLSGVSSLTGNFELRNGTVTLSGANRFTGNPTLINGGAASTLNRKYSDGL